MRTLTTTEGNPAHSLAKSLDELKAIENPLILHERLLKIVGKHKDEGGISDNNWKKFKVVATQKLRTGNPLFSLRKYMFDFLLAADGLAVIGQS